MSLKVDPNVCDCCSVGRKAKYILFNDGAALKWMTKFSSMNELLRTMMRRSDVEMSAHDISGKLIAYTKNGKVVTCL